jgi:hypothetical protein
MGGVTTATASSTLEKGKGSGVGGSAEESAKGNSRREKRFKQPLSYIIRRDKSLYWLMWGREIPTDTVFARDDPGFRLGCSLSNAPEGPTQQQETEDDNEEKNQMGLQ